MQNKNTEKNNKNQQRILSSLCPVKPEEDNPGQCDIRHWPNVKSGKDNQPKREKKDFYFILSIYYFLKECVYLTIFNILIILNVPYLF
jgi:hypothetical protein